MTSPAQSAELNRRRVAEGLLTATQAGPHDDADAVEFRQRSAWRTGLICEYLHPLEDAGRGHVTADAG
jgi:hypothetical protein